MTPAVDPRLVDQMNTLRAELARIEAAAPPVDMLVERELKQFDSRAEEFKAHPFVFARPTYGTTISPAAVERFVMAMSGAMIPGARKFYERSLREKLAPGLHLDPADKERQLADLHAQLRMTQARVETDRRRIEAESGDILPRVREDPAIWLLVDDDLQRAVTGEPPMEVKHASPDDPGGRTVSGASAGQL